MPQHDHTHPAEAAWYASIRPGDTWHTAAERAMKHLTHTGQPFSADDLRDLLNHHAPDTQPPTPNAIGGHRHEWVGVGNHPAAA